MAVTNISMTPRTRMALQTCALLRGASMARVVADALAEFIERHGLLKGGEWRIRPNADHAWGRATAAQAEAARVMDWDVELVDED
ncbi:TPA: hypothetical protein QDC27_003237 [Burkholderia cepacia ATCC 25416]|uniref:hypothetical protein n=1 Tax=Burkholderia cepacia TaxID=292 RepID=UPI002657DBEA|nr:hypothetical protein [Burkholderia cepacia]HDR9767887.1 hypothetical protein [Burkholderia cepacia ATCC 25416]HDR9775442.1 hypothetical protein [Burkholderia cepacia ATCC 25416]HDR9784044.1 hypothetical protein [Burkholderia cepacia ATCC 25416]HDR9791861.1 hypothetical protein [Burkholderia cepacia ATCC 25416]